MKNTETLQRFLRYVKINTTSSETSGTHPSTPGQFDLAKLLQKELDALGAEEIFLSDTCTLYAKIPPTRGLKKMPSIGFIAHMDTSSSASGENVHPQVVDYDGGPIPLGKEKTLDPSVFPELNSFKGKTLVVTDGTTLLGADDKAGIAEIMGAVERMKKEKIPHGRICIAFTPDEEIGEGVLQFDMERFGADCAFTMDGGDVRCFEYQNFNAAAAEVRIRGLSVHPGSAKGLMRNAISIGFEFQSMLPPGERPEHTSGTEGFYHLHAISGDTSAATLHYLIRDHDADRFAARKRTMEGIARILQGKYGKENITLTIRDQYRNMEEVILRYPFLKTAAENAIRKAGLVPSAAPIRGGTDGALLSWRGLPCPNLGTGGRNYHGEYEYLCVEEMESAVQIILNILEEFTPGRNSLPPDSGNPPVRLSRDR